MLILAIERAIRERRMLRLRYHGASRGVTTEREIEPHFLASVSGNWTLVAGDPGARPRPHLYALAHRGAPGPRPPLPPSRGCSIARATRSPASRRTSAARNAPSRPSLRRRESALHPRAQMASKPIARRAGRRGRDRHGATEDVPEAFHGPLKAGESAGASGSPQMIFTGSPLSGGRPACPPGEDWPSAQPRTR